MALFELTELASYMQSDLDTASATLARDIATALVEECVGGPIESGLRENVPLPVYVDGTIDLATRTPVTGVTSVTVDAVTRTDVMWRQPYPSVLLTEWTAPSRDEWPVALVTFTSGYPVVPPLAKAIALAAASRAYVVAPPPGVSLQIDDYRESTSAGADASTTTTLTEQERRALASLGGFVAAVTGP